MLWGKARISVLRAEWQMKDIDFNDHADTIRCFEGIAGQCERVYQECDFGGRL